MNFLDEFFGVLGRRKNTDLFVVVPRFSYNFSKIFSSASLKNKIRFPTKNSPKKQSPNTMLLVSELLPYLSIAFINASSMMRDMFF
ncbi:MAG: hypothetical protein EAZ92_09895 [Candidatus Kapaibacterium sp.]|nr:MAG: hypothetical protein EAZ92_09895 [Candidatus Kapabacteria bacterium]